MLDLSKLENIKQHGYKIIAACPACRAEHHDRAGDHLAIFAGDDGMFENGKYICIKHENDSDHSREIFALIGRVDEKKTFDKEARRQYAIKAQQREQAARDKQRLTNHLQSTLEKRLAPYLLDSWRAELFDRSPIHLECIDAIPRDFLKCLFPMDAILWMGNDEYAAGSEQHRVNFKPCREWLKLEALPPRIAPAHFLQDSFSRSSVNVTSSPFIIIECDDIIGVKPCTDSQKERNKQLTAALALYAEDKLGLNLRAVIDTSNKSLHLWFDRPPPDAMEAIRKMLAGLRIDPGPFEQSHIPLRMPHCIHHKTNQSARLLYLNHLRK